MTAGLRFPRGVYGITPEWDDDTRLERAIREAAGAGLSALQFRRKTLAPEAALRQAMALAALCRELGVVFIVNDNWELAAHVGADGVHLGRADGSPLQARRALGTGKIIGCSCYNDTALAVQALRADVDYIAFGAVYPSKIKPDAVGATLDVIREGRALAVQSRQAGENRAAVVAIGGITADNAGPVVNAGADSLAMINGLFEAPDIGAAAKRCTDLFGA